VSDDRRQKTEVKGSGKSDPSSLFELGRGKIQKWEIERTDVTASNQQTVGSGQRIEEKSRLIVIGYWLEWILSILMLYQLIAMSYEL